MLIGVIWGLFRLCVAHYIPVACIAAAAPRATHTVRWQRPLSSAVDPWLTLNLAQTRWRPSNIVPHSFVCGNSFQFSFEDNASE
jgi:hypothetical protein